MNKPIHSNIQCCNSIHNAYFTLFESCQTLVPHTTQWFLLPQFHHPTYHPLLCWMSQCKQTSIHPVKTNCSFKILFSPTKPLHREYSFLGQWKFIIHSLIRLFIYFHPYCCICNTGLVQLCVTKLQYMYIVSNCDNYKVVIHMRQ